MEAEVMTVRVKRSLSLGLGLLLSTTAIPAAFAEPETDTNSRRLETIRVEGQQVDTSVSDLAVDFAEFARQLPTGLLRFIGRERGDPRRRGQRHLHLR